jgi:hypothetical protein
MAKSSVTSKVPPRPHGPVKMTADQPDGRVQPSGVHYLREGWEENPLSPSLTNRFVQVDECLKAVIAIQAVLQRDRLRTELAHDCEDEYVYAPMSQADVDGLGLGTLMLLREAEELMAEVRDNHWQIAENPLRSVAAHG